jgi:hypothetical protein
MVEVDPFVPDRVPDGVGHGLDVTVPVMDQHHVEVGIGAQRAASIPTYRQKGQVAASVPTGSLGQFGEPIVGFGGIATAEFVASQLGLAQQCLPPVTE